MGNIINMLFGPVKGRKKQTNEELAAEIKDMEEEEVNMKEQADLLDKKAALVESIRKAQAKSDRALDRINGR
jgi:hypothetical protein